LPLDKGSFNESIMAFSEVLYEQGGFFGNYFFYNLVDTQPVNHYAIVVMANATSQDATPIFGAFI
jgi:hypothetical protein